MFNPFAPELMTALLEKVETGLANGTIKHLFLVCDNPVYGEVLNESSSLSRLYSRMFDLPELSQTATLS
jgi:hypothetical protein